MMVFGGLASSSHADALDDLLYSGLDVPDSRLNYSAYTDSVFVELYGRDWRMYYPFMVVPTVVPPMAPFFVDFSISQNQNPGIPMNEFLFVVVENTGSLLPEQEDYVTSPFHMGAVLIYIDSSVPSDEQACALIEQMTWDQDFHCSDTTLPPDHVPGPGVFDNLACYPNPFNPTTTVHFTLEVSRDLEMRVFNILGQEVASQDLGRLDAGYHAFRLPEDDQPSGLRIIQLSSGNDKAYIRATKVR